MAHLYTWGVLARPPAPPGRFRCLGRRTFCVRVTDSETGRGVPLVQLSTPRDAMRFWTDSAGVAAIDDDALNGHDVIFTIKSHGYEFDERLLGEPAGAHRASLYWTSA